MSFGTFTAIWSHDNGNEKKFKNLKNFTILLLILETPSRSMQDFFEESVRDFHRIGRLIIPPYCPMLKKIKKKCKKKIIKEMVWKYGRSR